MMLILNEMIFTNYAISHYHAHPDVYKLGSQTKPVILRSTLTNMI